MDGSAKPISKSGRLYLSGRSQSQLNKSKRVFGVDVLCFFVHPLSLHQAQAGRMVIVLLLLNSGARSDQINPGQSNWVPSKTQKAFEVVVANTTCEKLLCLDVSQPTSGRSTPFVFPPIISLLP